MFVCNTVAGYEGSVFGYLSCFMQFFSIYEVAISPDGSKVLATAGNMILVSSSRSIAQTSNFSGLNVSLLS